MLVQHRNVTVVPPKIRRLRASPLEHLDRAHLPQQTEIVDLHPGLATLPPSWRRIGPAITRRPRGRDDQVLAVRASELGRKISANALDTRRAIAVARAMRYRIVNMCLTRYISFEISRYPDSAGRLVQAKFEPVT